MQPTQDVSKNMELTMVNLLRNDLGRPFLPPPCEMGFWQANSLVPGSTVNTMPSSGINTSPL